MTTTPTDVDAVNPSHYRTNTLGLRQQCIEYSEHLCFRRGNAFKYIWRAGLKGPGAVDLEKAAWYIERDILRGTGLIPDRPGHLTHALATSVPTLRQALLWDLWGRHDLTRTHDRLAHALEDPDRLDTLFTPNRGA